MTNQNKEPRKIPDTELPSYVDNYYLAFYRYSKLDSKLDSKLLPRLKSYNFPKNISPLQHKITSIQDKLLQVYPQHIHLEYTADKLFIGSGLSPYSGYAITALHSVYGIPYIEGSSVKGLLRDCIIHEKYDCNKDVAILDPFFQKIFGVSSDHTTDNSGRGKLVFFDSFPKSKFTLEKDIQTPHYIDYYSSKGEKSPADDDKLNMFTFYVAKDTTFRIMIGMLEKFSDTEVRQIKSYLTMALEDYGLGGKTNVGYGLGEVKFV